MDFQVAPAHHPAHFKVPRWLKIVLIVVVILVLVGAGWSSYRKSTVKTPFPSDIAANLAYPIYYPSGLKGGYSYKAGTAKIQAGILFYTVSNGSKKILITEQNVPHDGINLKSLPEHSPLDVPIGKAQIGTGLGKPSAVIMAPETLVQITSTGGVTKADIISAAQAMAREY